MKEGIVKIVDTTEVSSWEDVCSLIGSINFEEAGEDKTECYDYYSYCWEISKQTFNVMLDCNFNPADYDFSYWDHEMEKELEIFKEEPNGPDDQFPPEVYEKLELNPEWNRNGDWNHDEYEACISFYYAIPEAKFNTEITRETLSKSKTWIITVPRAFRVLARPEKKVSEEMGCGNF